MKFKLRLAPLVLKLIIESLFFSLSILLVVYLIQDRLFFNIETTLLLRIP